jgi:hypothetical protein
MSTETPAQEFFRIISGAVEARRAMGMPEAIQAVAREIGLTKSRITETHRGRVMRPHVDEWQAARAWAERDKARKATLQAHRDAITAIKREMEDYR